MSKLFQSVVRTIRTDSAKSRWIWAGVAMALVAMTVWFLRPRSLAEETARLHHAERTGDTDRLFAAISAEEKQAFDLTREKYREFYREFIAPIHRRYRVLGTPTVITQASGGMALLRVEAVGSGGRMTELTFAGYASPEGIKSELTNRIVARWIDDFIVQPGAVMNQENLLDARLQGLARDRRRLEALGITGLFWVNVGGTKLETWDEAATRWRSRLTNLRNRGLTSPSKT